MHEQRIADAAGPPPPDDSTDARPEAPVLELPSIPIRSPEEAVPIPGLGAGVAHLRFLGVASNRPSRPDARTVNFENCCVRQSPPVRGCLGWNDEAAHDERSTGDAANLPDGINTIPGDRHGKSPKRMSSLSSQA